jgi:hypothetical protein
MADIFISYSSADRKFARKLAAAFADQGRTVWWDREIPHGKYFDRVIERELKNAKLVVVLWSITGVESDWCRAEAALALEHNKLLPIVIDASRPPLRFMHLHTADLSQWDGDPTAEPFRLLCRDLPASGAGMQDVADSEVIATDNIKPNELASRNIANATSQLRAVLFPSLFNCYIGLIASYAAELTVVRQVIKPIMEGTYPRSDDDPLAGLSFSLELWMYYSAATAVGALIGFFAFQDSIRLQSVMIGIFSYSIYFPLVKLLHFPWGQTTWQAGLISLGIATILLSVALQFRYRPAR